MRLKVAKEACTLKVWDINNKLKLIDSTEIKNFEVCRKYAMVRNICDSLRLQERIKELEKIQTEGINNVEISFLGVNFDINDLGLIGGFTFVVLMLWFQYSLMNELRNYKIIFKVTDGIEEKILCYSLLSMHQVLTIPSIKNIEEKSLFTKAPVLLFFLPLLVQFAIIINDLKTFEFGKSISLENTIISYGGSFIFLFLILFLTTRCVYLFKEIDKTLSKNRT